MFRCVRFLSFRRSGKAGMAELADAQDSGSCRSDPVQVQVLLPAPSLNSLNFFVIKRMFGLFCFMSEFETFNE